MSADDGDLDRWELNARFGFLGSFLAFAIGTLLFHGFDNPKGWAVVGMIAGSYLATYALVMFIVRCVND